MERFGETKHQEVLNNFDQLSQVVAVPQRAYWNESELIVLDVAITLPRNTISKPEAIELCNQIDVFLRTGSNEETVNKVSEWLNNNGFAEASLAIDAEWEL